MRRRFFPRRRKKPDPAAGPTPRNGWRRWLRRSPEKRGAIRCALLRMHIRERPPDMRAIPENIGVIHFVGIGGIGMSGIAEILHNMGYRVQGSDLNEGGNVTRLRDKGIRVETGHRAQNIM